VKIKALATTLSTTLVVAGLAAVWAVASPLSAGCAAAVPLDQISAVPSESDAFVAQINQLRRSQGLNDLAVDGNLTSIAQNWAVNMASQDSIFHRADLRDGVTVNWRRLGENVGMGPNVDDLMQAFIASPGHYKNLVDPTFTHIGVGSVRTPDGLMYTAHEFAAISGASAAPTPVTAAPAPRVTTPRVTTPRAPRATTPPTTAAPVTTTTEPPVEVQRSVAQQDELQDSSAEDDQQEQDKHEGRCRAHSAQRLTAVGTSAVSRPV